MTWEKGRQDKVEGSQRPQNGLHIVRSVAGDETWRSLWDWLLGPDSPTESAAKESKVANGHSQGPHINIRPSKEQNKEN